MPMLCMLYGGVDKCLTDLMNRVDNFVPGKMDEMGIGYEQLSQHNPGLIHASISGVFQR